MVAHTPRQLAVRVGRWRQPDLHRTLLPSRSSAEIRLHSTHPSSTVAVVRANYVNSIDASAGVVYRLRTMDQTLSLNASPGYDDVTGLGTPTSSFLSALK